MLTSILVLCIAVIALVVIIYPLFSKQDKLVSPDTFGLDWEQEKEQVFLELADLEYDYQMGKILQSDYEKTKDELMKNAVHYIKSKENEQKHIEEIVDQEIELFLLERGARHED